MAAILKNGGHFGISSGQRLYVLRVKICENFCEKIRQSDFVFYSAPHLPTELVGDLGGVVGDRSGAVCVALCEFTV